MHQTLLEQLKDFGLNPKEWTLAQRADSTSITLTSKQDKSLQLLGQFKQYENGVYWKDLCWI